MNINTIKQEIEKARTDSTMMGIYGAVVINSLCNHLSKCIDILEEQKYYIFYERVDGPFVEQVDNEEKLNNRIAILEEFFIEIEGVIKGNRIY